MTTINTSEDLLRLLREDTHFYEQARRLILTDELINLPERFAAFAARVDNFITEQQATNQRVDAFITEQQATNQRVDAFITEQQATNQRVDAFITEQQATNQRVDAFITEQQGTNQRVDDFITEQQGTNQRVDDFIDEQQTTHQRIERILADLRGSLTVRICRQNSDNIAAALGLSIADHLTPAALRAMVRSNQPADATDGDLQSFYRADLIASALDQDDNEAYLAVEASFTADTRDTRRATRNASLLTELTGRPAHAVIAARHIDNDIRDEIQSGAVHWYELDEHEFTPD